MARGLLLGNGINARIGINDFSIKSIANRFQENVRTYFPIFENLFGVKINEDFFANLDNRTENLGIEVLAGYLYRYVKRNKHDRWTDNDEYRIQDVLTCICLSAIFYKKEGKIEGNFDETKMIPLKGYDYIFTLNYFEFWDYDQKSIYLHGKIDWSNLADKKNAILISGDRMGLVEYVKAVTDMKKTHSIVECEPYDIVFAPSQIEKKNLVCVSGIYPSENLYPDEDLFIYDEKELYTDLNNVDELDIFGMSPYGDESLIDYINKKNKVRVYIYEKSKNKEAHDWAQKLKCPFELLDSTDI